MVAVAALEAVDLLEEVVHKMLAKTMHGKIRTNRVVVIIIEKEGTTRRFLEEWVLPHRNFCQTRMINLFGFKYRHRLHAMVFAI